MYLDMQFKTNKHKHNKRGERDGSIKIYCMFKRIQSQEHYWKESKLKERKDWFDESFFVLR